MTGAEPDTDNPDVLVMALGRAFFRPWGSAIRKPCSTSRRASAAADAGVSCRFDQVGAQERVGSRLSLALSSDMACEDN